MYQDKFENEEIFIKIIYKFSTKSFDQPNFDKETIIKYCKDISKINTQNELL